jgi:hypothetical protein
MNAPQSATETVAIDESNPVVPLVIAKEYFALGVRLARAEALLSEARDRLADLARTPTMHARAADDAYVTIGRIVLFLGYEKAHPDKPAPVLTRPAHNALDRDAAQRWK